MNNKVILICLIVCLIGTPLNIIKDNMSGAAWGIVGAIFCFGVLMSDR